MLNPNFSLGILGEHLAESFDVLLMGDMFFDETLGAKLSKLAETFQESGGNSKMVLIGDPGQSIFLNQNTVRKKGDV